ncbi:hypothetical protein Tco_1288215, partial [Tanacetum coccineum]
MDTTSNAAATTQSVKNQEQCEREKEHRKEAPSSNHHPRTPRNTRQTKSSMPTSANIN